MATDRAQVQENFLQDFAKLLHRYNFNVFPHGSRLWCVRGVGEWDNPTIIFNRQSERDLDRRIEECRKTAERPVFEPEKLRPILQRALKSATVDETLKKRIRGALLDESWVGGMVAAAKYVAQFGPAAIPSELSGALKVILSDESEA